MGLKHLAEGMLGFFSPRFGFTFLESKFSQGFIAFQELSHGHEPIV